MKITFVGANPTKQTKKDKNGNYVPFKGTRSEAVLKSWIKFLGLKKAEYVVINAYPNPTPGNKPPTVAQLRQYSSVLKSRTEGTLVIALGMTADKALDLAEITPDGYLPHPSGLNRKLNDKEQTNLILTLMRYHVALWRDYEKQEQSKG